MAWLTSRRKKSDDAPVAVLEPETSQQRLHLPTGPSLAVLVPDIAGISSFRFSLTPDADTAEQQIVGLRPDVRRGTHAFWALHDQPNVSDETHVEALVLIRTSEHSDVVYVVSFLDLESALSFTRFEVRRGLYLGNVMVYWAAFAQVREDSGGVSVTPRTAPSTRPSWPMARDEIIDPVEEGPVIESRSPAAPAVGPATETNEAIERYLRERGRKEMAEADLPAIDDAMPTPRPPVVEERSPAPRPPIEDRAPAMEPPTVEEPALIAEPPVIEDSPVIPPPLADSAPITDAIQIADAVEAQAEAPFSAPAIELSETVEAADSPAIEDTLFSPIPAEQAAIEEAVVFQHQVAPASALSAEAIESGMVVDDPAPLAGPVEAFTGDEEITDSLQAEQARRRETELERLFAAAEVRGIPGDEELERPKVVAVVGPNGEIPLVKPYDEFNIAYEVERLLRNRRWTDKKEGDDFDGFKSPPGRF